MLHHKLQDMRKNRNLTLQQVADRSNHPLSTVSRVFSGETASPGFLLIRDIVYAMDGSLDDLADAKAAPPTPAPQTPAVQLDTSPAKENKTLQVLLICVLSLCCLLLLLVIAALAYDFLNKRVGFFWLD